MIIYSLNANGLKSSLNKGIENSLFSKKPDIICLQETKCQSKILELNNYYSYWNFCSKKGYSGTAIYTKIKPISVNYSLDEDFDVEGRIITLEFKDFYLVNVYVPNSKTSIARINYRMDWDELFFNYIMKLESHKPVIMCGDFNIAYSSIDSDDNSFENEFVDNERDEFENILNNGFIDSFRYFYPNKEKCYTWWNVGKDDKENKLGYRLDYFLVSQYLIDKLIDSKIHEEINCSDHCPISLSINLKESE